APVPPSATKSAISAQDLLPIVSAPSPLFTGRADVLSQLEKYFVDGPFSLELSLQRRFILYGLGGAGKTQIALQFSYKFRS
ncbi:hypothetical protein C0995_000588, partial [Termitomyces sp. Mi166